MKNFDEMMTFEELDLVSGGYEEETDRDIECLQEIGLLRGETGKYKRGINVFRRYGLVTPYNTKKNVYKYVGSRYDTIIKEFGDTPRIVDRMDVLKSLCTMKGMRINLKKYEY